MDNFMNVEEFALSVRYTNWRGETAVRRIVPRRVWWGSTDWHPRPQWLLAAYDLDKGQERDFALAEMDIASLQAAASEVRDE